jgi:hypothetical protein
MENATTRSGRRNFLAALGAGGAATAAAVASKVVPQQPKATGTTVDERGAKGYELSEHVRNYYRTARV